MSRHLLKPLGAIPRQCRPGPIRAALQRPAPAQQLAAPFHTTPRQLKKKSDAPPAQRPRTDFQEMDVLGDAPVPQTAIDHCAPTGFFLDGGVQVVDGSGVLLVNGEAFRWRPWEASGKMELLNKKGQFEVPAESFGVLDLLWPKPGESSLLYAVAYTCGLRRVWKMLTSFGWLDILIIGTGPRIAPLSPETRKHLSAIGMRVEVLDTNNAASQFNLLATERGVDDIAAVLIPVGWKEGVGAVE